LSVALPGAEIHEFGAGRLCQAEAVSRYIRIENKLADAH
jgi:hypothetical protein